jgi:hypothetical protein
MSIDLKSGQLNWFDLETKCQRLVYDVMQPTINRQNEQTTQFSQLKNEVHEDMSKRIAELEFYVFGKTAEGAQNPTKFDLI